MNFRFRVLESLRVEFGAKVGSYSSWLLILGQVILVSSCFLILFLFLLNFRVEVLDSFTKTLFIVSADTFIYSSYMGYSVTTGDKRLFNSTLL